MGYILAAVLFSTISFSQVGIGTTSPYSTLDVKSSSESAPTSTDGLLIPKINVFPSNPTANQQGMLVYLTTTASNKTPGFYYWDFPSLSWIGFSTSSASSNFEVMNIEDFLFDRYGGSAGPQTGVANDNQYAFSPIVLGGATSTVENAATNNDYMGIHKLSTGTTASAAGKASVASSDWYDKIRLGAYEVAYETRIRLSVQSGIAYTGLFGLSNLVWNGTLVGTASTAGVYFEYNGGNLYGTCRDAAGAASGFTRTSSFITPVNNQWYKLKAVVNAARTSVDFYVDGVKLGNSVTTNIPSTTQGMKHTFLVEKVTSTATASICDVDYITWRLGR